MRFELTQEQIEDIRKCPYDTDWWHLCSTKILSNEFIIEFIQHLEKHMFLVYDARLFSEYGPIDVDFARKLIKHIIKEELDVPGIWEFVFYTYPFEEEFIVKHLRRICLYNFQYLLFARQQLSESLILSISNWREYSGHISENQNLSWEFIKKNLEIFNEKRLMLNENILPDVKLKIQELIENKNNLSRLIMEKGIVGKTIQ